MRRLSLLVAATAAAAIASVATGQEPAPPVNPAAAMPWMDTKLSPDARAALVVAAMTLDEKIHLMHGTGFSFDILPGSNGGAGYVGAIPRLGLPALEMADSTVGVTRGALQGRYATSMPASIAEASAWSPELSYAYGALVGSELRAQGYNVSLGGGVNLLREPRNGRSFEYRGEDPVLAGTLTGHWIRGIQSQNVVGDVKHFALNDQETGRLSVNVAMDYRDARESDLLAFEIAIRDGEPGMVMCSYNKVNGDWGCNNAEYLTRTLKQEWGFKGFVISDWGAAKSTEKAVLAGLDQEQPGETFFGASLKEAVQRGAVPEARIDDAARRIVRTMFAHGLIDMPIVREVPDVQRGLEVAQRVAEEGSVLLANNGILPLARRGRIAIIGSHADVGVLTGGGSGQVDPPGGNAVAKPIYPTEPELSGLFGGRPVWYPSSPLAALQFAAPEAAFVYDNGLDPGRAAELARSADVVLLFAHQPSSEGRDQESLALPGGQDALIEAVAAANAKTVVVLETGGPVSMPWLGKVAAVIETWFPGARGGEAIARLLLGDVNFTGKLPVTFARSEADLPQPVVPGTGRPQVPAEGFAPLPNGERLMTPAPFDIRYVEGVKVGYKWFDAEGKDPLFAFGHGLSYTRYDYSDLKADRSSVTFTVRNSGARAGVEIAQVYAALPAKKRRVPRQLVGWTRVSLAPGAAKTVTVKLEPLALSVFDDKGGRWRQRKGQYEIFVGRSSRDTPLKAEFALR